MQHDITVLLYTTLNCTSGVAQHPVGDIGVFHAGIVQPVALMHGHRFTASLVSEHGSGVSAVSFDMCQGAGGLIGCV